MFRRSAVSSGAMTIAPAAVAEPARPVRLRSRKAIVALILAILGFLLGVAGLWLLTTPFVVVLAIWALVDIRRGRVINGKVMAWVAIGLTVVSWAFWLYALSQIYSHVGAGIGLD